VGRQYGRWDEPHWFVAWPHSQWDGVCSKCRGGVDNPLHDPESVRAWLKHLEERREQLELDFDDADPEV
jgi:hypothetical protein